MRFCKHRPTACHALRGELAIVSEADTAKYEPRLLDRRCTDSANFTVGMAHQKVKEPNLRALYLSQ